VVVFALSLLDLIVIWLLPVGFLVVCWLAASAVVYVLLVLPIRSDVKEDLAHRYRRKAALRSGSTYRPSYLHVAKLLVGDNCVQATILYRITRFLARHRLRTVAEALHGFSKLLTNLDVSPLAEIGPGVYFYHGLGTVIGKGTRIGRRAIICQQVTTGGGPTIGDDVCLWAGAKVIGRIFVGDRVEVGANAVVIRDVPPDSIVVGVPATRIIAKSWRGDATQNELGAALE